MANTILVKDIPEKILKEIDKEQAAFKIHTGTILNQSKAVIKMLRDYIKCRDTNNFKPDKI
jgi:hypothetical protein